jgi:aspartyl aminopeptidase
VNSASTLLEEAGFTKIQERQSWSSLIKSGGKYYLTRNGSSLVAFAVGGAWQPGNPVAMVGTHTDSPVLKVKPVSDSSKVGYLQVGVEAYGGGIWHTWFDRDLSVAGRVMVRDGEGQIVQKLVKVEKPIVRIPTLAIHLHRQSDFDPNKETELFPILGLIAAELNRGDGKEGKKGGDEASEDADDEPGSLMHPLQPLSKRHHPYFVETVAKSAGVEADAIVDFELVLYDTHKSCIGGLNDELIFSPRLDNQEMTFCAIAAITRSVDSHSLEDDATVRLVACFDHEEIGSKSAQGADSSLLPDVLKRLSKLKVPLPRSRASTSSGESFHKVTREGEADTATAYEQTLVTSFMVSADMAHSVHPNYSAKYEANHHCKMNGGTVIKLNAQQRYMTNAPGIVLMQEVAKRAGVPLQLFVSRNDVPCGSTIGPLLASRTGIRTLDLGNPQLSMHSIRETGGSHDVEHAIKLFASFFQHYGKLEAKILVD